MFDHLVLKDALRPAVQYSAGLQLDLARALDSRLIEPHISQLKIEANTGLVSHEQHAAATKSLSGIRSQGNLLLSEGIHQPLCLFAAEKHL